MVSLPSCIRLIRKFTTSAKPCTRNIPGNTINVNPYIRSMSVNTGNVKPVPVRREIPLMNGVGNIPTVGLGTWSKFGKEV